MQQTIRKIPQQRSRSQVVQQTIANLISKIERMPWQGANAMDVLLAKESLQRLADFVQEGVKR